jgi:hypothetical protein
MDNENKNINEENVGEEAVNETPVTNNASQENEEPEIIESATPKKRKKKRFLKPLVICTSILLVLVILAGAAYAVLAHFVLFPDFAMAMGNTLKSKLDIGTEFDFLKLVDGGTVEVEAENMDGRTEDLSFLLNYNDSGYNANIKLDKYEMDLAFTEKGLAYSSNKLNDGQAYGISFKNIEKTLEESVLHHRSDSDYALEKDDFKKKVKQLQRLAESASGSKQAEKDLKIIYGEIAKAFDESAISEYDTARGGVKIDGEIRQARSQVYNFKTKDISKFLDNVAERFDEPSAKVEKAVERFGETEIAEAFASYIGYSLNDSEDMADLFEKLADMVDANFAGCKFNVVVAYVGQSVSVMQIKITNGDNVTMIQADFGEQPKRSYGVDISIEALSNNVKTKTVISYDVVSIEDGRRARLEMLNYVYSDAKAGFYEMSGVQLNLKFNEEKEEVTFSFVNINELMEKGIEEPVVRKTTAMEILCEYEDTSSKLAIDFKNIKINGKESDDVGDIKITVSNKTPSVKLPKFERVFEMSERDYKDYREEVDKFKGKLRADELNGMGMIPEMFSFETYFN